MAAPGAAVIEQNQLVFSGKFVPDGEPVAMRKSVPHYQQQWITGALDFVIYFDVSDLGNGHITPPRKSIADSIISTGKSSPVFDCLGILIVLALTPVS
jgi:hypothetical protein